MIDTIATYGASVLFTIVLIVWMVASNHRRRHLFVASCPLCRRDPYRMAIAAEQLGLAPQGTLIETVEEDKRHD